MYTHTNYKAPNAFYNILGQEKRIRTRNKAIREAKSSGSLPTHCETPWIDRNTFCAVIRFINTDKSVSQLKHVVSKTANIK